MFANKYLAKTNPHCAIERAPDANCNIRVVIPCFHELGILQTLRSLDDCALPSHNVEVLVVINHSEIAPENIKAFNAGTKKEIERWAGGKQNPKLAFFALGPFDLPKKWAGAGLARKRGMDEAVARFNLTRKPGGIIVSLDADTLVSSNYFVEIERHFAENPKDVGATIAFRHQKQGLPPRHLEGIQLYEKYLGYYKKALEFTGYPHSLFTVGSAFAVTAEAYVKRGGMNRRQAGEDFYFLQNLAQIGRVGEIADTCVFPSARLSLRVPFGTGPILKKWMDGDESLRETYSLRAFKDLKSLFDIHREFYRIGQKCFDERIDRLNRSISTFISLDNFWEDICDLNRNCSSAETFSHRFFEKFNAFKILKFLNFAHEGFYEKAALEEQIIQLERALDRIAPTC